MRKHNPIPLEHDIQSAFFDWVRLAKNMHPVLKLMFAVPNAGKRSFKTAARMKAEGLVSGVPDVMFPVARRGFNGLAMEFKRPKQTPTENQLEFMDGLQKENWLVVVVTDSEAAIRTVKDYLGS